MKSARIVRCVLRRGWFGWLDRGVARIWRTHPEELLGAHGFALDEPG